MPLLLEAVRHWKGPRIVDLCSGAGGPWRRWAQRQLMPCPVVLTDKFPNAIASEFQESDWLQYFPEPVDATMVPTNLTGFRTIFTAFHHFTPDQGRAIIADAIAQRQPIAIFEFTARSLAAILFMLASPLAVWAITPRLPRVTWRKLVFTYLIPVIPAIVTFDGIVSCLRTYIPDELKDMAAQSDYAITHGSVRGGKWPIPITYFIAMPRNEHPAISQELGIL